MELLRHERSWNPSTPELVVTLSLFGGVALLAAATTLLAVEALRRIRQASDTLRSHAAARGIAWFWPVILVETLLLLVAPTGLATPQRPTLIYETEPKVAPLSETIGKTWNVIGQRLGKGREQLAYTRLLENGCQFAVSVIGPSEADRQRIERLVTSPGTLEFHILADPKHDKAIVERALKAPSDSEVVDSSGKKVAWWVPIKASEQRNIANYPGIVWRSTKQGADEATQSFAFGRPL